MTRPARKAFVEERSASVRIISWLWARTSAAVAVALIFGALALGWSLGRSSSAPARPAVADEHADHGPAVFNAENQYYTCSMHPSVRLTDPDAKCPICFMSLIPVEETGAGANDNSPATVTLSAAAMALARVETAPVERRYIDAEVRLFGVVAYDETRIARITAYFPGRIERLFVNYTGVPVAAGEHVAEVYSPDLLAAFEELRQASRTSLSGAGIMRDSAADLLRAAREKLRLFGLTQAQIAAAERGDISGDAFEIFSPMSGVVTQLAAREGDYIQTGTPIATVADLDRLWLDLRAYESDLSMLRWGQRVSFTVAAIPGETFTGDVSFIDPVVDRQSRTTVVRVAVDNRERRLKPGMYANAVVSVTLSDRGVITGDSLAGLHVCPMHPTEVTHEPGACAVCGMDLVPADTLRAERDQGGVPPLVIPRSAALVTGARAVVYVRASDHDAHVFEGREVVLGPRAGDYYIVRSGLREGEHVVVRGAFRLDSEMQIQAKPSMMSPDAGGAPGIHDHGGRVGTPAPASPRTARPIVSRALAASIESVLIAHGVGQDALAADDFDGYLASLPGLEDAIARIDTRDADTHAVEIWTSSRGQLLPARIPTDISDARTLFEASAHAAIELARAFGAGDAESVWTVAHCPMAFDNRGAEWLQRGVTINNPYFGSAMLRCGDITERIEPAPAAEHEGHNHD